MARNTPDQKLPGEFAILREAVENTNEAFVTIDENHQVVFFNKAAENIFGYKRSEIVGCDLNEILTPDCSKDHRAAVARYLETKPATLIGHETEFVAARKDGTRFPAAISFSVSTVADKLFFTALVRDLTEQRILEEQLSRCERLASLGQVVAEITHEIKNPLMLIGGFARQLKKTISGEKEKEKLAIIAGEVERLEHLLFELRDLYLPFSLSVSPIKINDVLREVYEMAKEDCGSREISISLKIDEQAKLVEGDEEKLKQVLLNLVKNAIEALEKGGNLTIESRLQGEEIAIRIADDGPGIAKDDQDKIFAPFYTTKKKGSGLGLNICRRIIDEHKGCSFDLVSEMGKGAAFTITLPDAR